MESRNELTESYHCTVRQPTECRPSVILSIQISVVPASGEKLTWFSPWCEESALIFPASFLVVEEYKSWMVGRGAIMIFFSAVLTVRCSVSLSYFVATLSQTDQCVHDGFYDSGYRQYVCSCCRKYILCGAFLEM